MWRRSNLWLLVAVAAFLCPGIFPEKALAQPDQTARIVAMEETVGLRQAVSLLARRAVPVRLMGLQVPDSLEVGESASFSAVANVARATLPIRCEWDFGDGTTANGLHAHHQYGVPGTYPVSVRLWNEHGDVLESFRVVVVPTSHSF